MASGGLSDTMPASGRSIPASSRSRVDLPAPFAPTSPTTSPAPPPDRARRTGTCRRARRKGRGPPGLRSRAPIMPAGRRSATATGSDARARAVAARAARRDRAAARRSAARRAAARLIRPRGHQPPGDVRETFPRYRQFGQAASSGTPPSLETRWIGAHPASSLRPLSVVPAMLSAMDSTALLIGALLLVVGLVIGVLIGRPTRARPAGTGAEVAALLAPASDALLRVEHRLHEVERDRVGAYAGLREQVAALHRSSADLGMQTRVAGRRAARAAGPRPVGRGAAAAHRRAGRHGASTATSTPRSARGRSGGRRAAASGPT